MTQEEIRKLLGGYATNTLSEREQAALFEAALDDQELFDALQNEDALRELLADPVSQEQIREALKPAATERPRVFWMRPWLIGAGSLAAAAVIAIAIVTWHREPAATSAPQQVAQDQIEPKLEAPQPAPVIPAPAPARKPLPAIARQATPPAPLAASPVAGLAVAEAPSKQDLKAGSPADAPLYTGPLVRTSVLRSGPSGDAIRIEVVSELAGSLALYRADAAGQWQRVFPSNGPGVPIAANATYQIPDDPIAVRGTQEKLRLVIEPDAGPSFGAQPAAGQLNQPRAQAFEAKKAARGPLVVEVALGPGIPNKGN
jgi:hypothetical protein